MIRFYRFNPNADLDSISELCIWSEMKAWLGNTVLRLKSIEIHQNPSKSIFGFKRFDLERACSPEHFGAFNAQIHHLERPEPPERPMPPAPAFYSLQLSLQLFHPFALASAIRRHRCLLQPSRPAWASAGFISPEKGRRSSKSSEACQIVSKLATQNLVKLKVSKFSK